MILFKDLQKLVQSQSDSTRVEILQRLKNKEFWIWDKHQHKLEDIKTDGDCCFNHISELPTKEGVEYVGNKIHEITKIDDEEEVPQPLFSLLYFDIHTFSGILASDDAIRLIKVRY